MLFDLVRRNRVFFLLYAVLLLVVGVLQILYTQESLMQWVNVRNNPAADVFFTYATYFGDGAFFVFVCLVLLVYNRRVGVMGFASFALSSLLSLFLKLVVFPDRLRPLKLLEHSTYQYRVIEGLDIYRYNSFPSGHTTTAFAVFSLLAFIDERRGRGWYFIVLAALTGYSRVYLFQHFVEDAYVGSLIGTASSVVIYLAMNRWVAAPKLSQK
ncbi:phosphatase PAP2 family protein [Spirosoma utsteinense]|uniref:Membrane-associated phospholipid phosphatase n=1 Tax=Spirosoma utsteinense TaxID=2585773 RepID=A0ABR6W3I5_9BACT|nr:phosphatase PAP2 family protein [Spirosoma utsteinense]MBC3784411.1 membrane-associated phospholipid phosphatase [Spirosoma utsteinense]MBC3790789.1 membrane-associated phospholipid phosphatase [Spirosoma utsteinense]